MPEKDNFLPEGYQIPSNSQYMKFENGVNTFRVLDKPIIGMEFWTSQTNDKGETKRVPNRRKMGEVIKMTELEVNPESGKIDAPQHFWAMPVWNYKEKSVQILEIKQKTVLEAIKSYIDNPKWGSPTQYDIVVTKSGEKLTTKYIVDHDPKEEISKEIVQEYKDMNINLEALFEGKDPFENSKKSEEKTETLEDAIEDMGKEEKAKKEADKMPF